VEMRVVKAMLQAWRIGPVRQNLKWASSLVNLTFQGEGKHRVEAEDNG